MKVPEPRTYWTSAAVDWLTPSLGPSPAKIRVFASPEAEHASEVDHRLIVHVVPETDLSDLESFLDGMPLKPLAHANTYLLETISPVDALLWGERLSTRADIVAAYPVESKPFKPRKAYASVPDDPFSNTNGIWIKGMPRARNWAWISICVQPGQCPVATVSGLRLWIRVLDCFTLIWKRPSAHLKTTILSRERTMESRSARACFTSQQSPD